MNTFIFIIVFLLKILFTKLFFMLIVFSLFFIKGKFVNYYSYNWDLFFKNLNNRVVLRFIIIIYILSSLISSILVFKSLYLMNFKSPLYITLFIFITTGYITFIRYKNNGYTKINLLLDKLKNNIE